MAKKPSKRKSFDFTLPIYQVKVSLQHTEPRIWRRVQTDDCSLDELHEIIQASMGWEGMHMYAFVIDDEEYGNPKHGGEVEYDSRFVRLSEVAEEGDSRFRYDYDFGDDWQHAIEIEKTLPAEKGVHYPRCVAGKGACPPEDSGGPFGYQFLLEKLQDPDHEEHEESLEWVGEDFDPEAFDLDGVNEELLRLRCWLGKRKGKHFARAAFAKGELVQVKPGIVHDQYPDIPLGGWVGKIKRIGWLTPIGYAVHWTGPTLDQAHPAYFKRCQRDGMKSHRIWLDEEQLESATDETPSAIEQPTSIITPPLSMEKPEDRIRMVFGLTSDDPLPKADEQTQRQFIGYLKAHLSFPFNAEYYPATSIGPGTGGKATVLGFANPPLERKAGIVCDARMGKKGCQVPLVGLHVEEDDPNFQYVEDYTYWLWEVQDFEEEDDELAPFPIGTIAYYGPDDKITTKEEEDDEPAPFPIGTIAYYGPDDKITTKIVAGVIKSEGTDPIIKRWVATDVATNPKVAKEIDRFFKKYGVTKVGMSDGNMGCPHEEGEDFPTGGDCPFCPWWKGKQGSGARR
jgi:hypothetical protein